MKLFSQRIGVTPIKSIVQVDSMDEDLKNSLWNALTLVYWDKTPDYLNQYDAAGVLYKKMWLLYFKQPLQTLPYGKSDLLRIIRDYFAKATWAEVYDFIEFVATSHPHEWANQEFILLCNTFLERELSAYRFVGSTLTKITDESELSAIDTAIKTPIQSVKTHLTTALNLLSDRKNPDYRNSIKESISAVESLAGLICGNQSASLGEAIKLIEKQSKVDWHPALKSSLDKLYGYTSNESGIRHGLIESDKIDSEEARFMLVLSSAFVNYLTIEANKAQIKLS